MSTNFIKQILAIFLAFATLFFALVTFFEADITYLIPAIIAAIISYLIFNRKI